MDNAKDKSVRTVNEWLDREDLDDGCTSANIYFKREYWRIRKELRRWAACLYVLSIEMENFSCTKMMYSAKRQAEFCLAVVIGLETRKIEKVHQKVFTKNIKSLNDRLKTIERITKENIHLTEYEPFFMAEVYDKEEYIDFDALPAMAEKWNAEHEDAVKAHMEAIQPELDRHNNFIQKKNRDRLAYKQEKKDKKKAENEYVKELKKNAEKNRTEYKKLERSFEKYYDGRA